MILTYQDTIKKYGSYYNVLKEIESGRLYKKTPGIYSTDKWYDELGSLFAKYNNIVLTCQSAFYFHGLSDYIPNTIYIATPKNAYPIRKFDVKQIFMKKEYFPIGIIELEIEGSIIEIYDKERTLIELIRYRSKINYEEYMHVLKNYREIASELDISKLIKYSKNFKAHKKIMKTVEESII